MDEIGIGEKGVDEGGIESKSIENIKDDIDIDMMISMI